MQVALPVATLGSTIVFHKNQKGVTACAELVSVSQALYRSKLCSTMQQ